VQASHVAIESLRRQVSSLLSQLDITQDALQQRDGEIELLRWAGRASHSAMGAA
jgi:hypothetical protein